MSSIYRVLGLMSGTSLDGLDLCLVEFNSQEDKLSYSIKKATTVSYNSEWKKRLSFGDFTGEDLTQLDRDYGRYLGEQVLEFMNGEKPDLIASHGQTIYHQPKKGYTLQIGHGGVLAEIAQCTVVSDFRSQDVALGGQGAPLVPIGDRDLFPQYPICLNLGGFANLSKTEDGERMAYDVCPVNMVLNHYAQEFGKEYDEGGHLSQLGQVNDELLSALNHLDFYKTKGPKSLGAEWVHKEMFPLLKSYPIKAKDALATLIEHLTDVLAKELKTGPVLITGGGAKNTHLINVLKSKCSVDLLVPDETLVDFKEALIFAYLGYLRWQGKINVLASVTGASKDSVSGNISVPG